MSCKRVRVFSPEEVREILNCNETNLDEKNLPTFDYPPADYEIMPEEDKGWTAIAKSVFVPTSRYWKVLQRITKHNPENYLTHPRSKKSNKSSRSRKNHSKLRNHQRRSRRGMAKVLSNQSLNLKLLETNTNKTDGKTSSNNLSSFAKSQKQPLEPINSRRLVTHSKRKRVHHKLKRPTLTVSKLNSSSFKQRFTVQRTPKAKFRFSLKKNAADKIQEFSGINDSQKRIKATKQKILDKQTPSKFSSDISPQAIYDLTLPPIDASAGHFRAKFTPQKAKKSSFFNDNSSVSEGEDYFRAKQSTFSQKYNIKEWYAQLCSRNKHIICQKKACMEYTFTSYFPNIAARGRHQTKVGMKSPEIRSRGNLMEKGIKRRYLKGTPSKSCASIRQLLKDKHTLL
ncbi:unnamed protein product [Moneuplotes crassus]|uniref:Uncharacterized protein n=1 Tax=Euplotes crassus TaxID=5936 RepID=A0AAD1U172_EUPCR|nr:unnamed protein product [Moneuplotes crassus]